MVDPSGSRYRNDEVELARRLANDWSFKSMRATITARNRTDPHTLNDPAAKE